MKNQEANKIPKREVTEEQVAKFRLDVRYFFLNYAKKNVKKNLWNLFEGWTYSQGESGASASEVADMLLFYQQLMELIEQVKQMSS